MITLQEVTKQEEYILHNLMQFYIYEFSKYIPTINLEQNGSYKPFELDKYWESNNCHAFFVMLDKEYIGFALVESETEISPNTINEFFIIQKYKGRGFGKITAIHLFNMFPGKWKITQIENNYSAQAFWRSVISDYTNNTHIEKYDERRRSIQEFDTR